MIPTGFVALDRHLPSGGWPRRSITEVLVDHYGIGELTLLMPALVRLTEPKSTAAAGRWIVWVAPPFIPYAPALVQRGVPLDRMLMVHPPQECSPKDRLWAVEQAVRSGSSAAVLAWIPAADGVALRRLQLASEQHDCWTVLFRSPRALADRSPAALRVSLFVERSATRLRIVKARGGRPAVVDLLPEGRADTGALRPW